MICPARYECATEVLRVHSCKHRKLTHTLVSTGRQYCIVALSLLLVMSCDGMQEHDPASHKRNAISPMNQVQRMQTAERAWPPPPFRSPGPERTPAMHTLVAHVLLDVLLPDTTG